MKSRLRSGFLLIPFFIVAISAGAQSGLDTLLQNYQARDAREKVYVHFDKNYYNPGETIWFKAYLFAGTMRSEISKNFYAELRDDEGKLINKITAPIVFSGAFSQFDLPATYSKNAVIFRAYTVAMLNGDTNFIYNKAIKIVNPVKRTIASKEPATRFSLLPEGGDLVDGLNAVVAFKAAKPDGTPVEVTGYVQSADGTKVTNFTSIHNGMGTFHMMPISGIQYTVFWKEVGGKEQSMPLPSSKPSGTVLHIQEKVEYLGQPAKAKQFTIQRSENAPEAQKQLTIIGVMNNELVYEARINLSSRTSVSASLPTVDLPTGILQVTLFDANMMPLAERVCFVNNGSFEFDADAWISELNLDKRALNRAEVKVADTLMANLSLSITDADLDVPPAYEDNIVSNVLLTGDLRGKIYQPYYYFYSTSDSIPLQLDLVMLTNGWRRYNWQKLFKPDPNEPRYIENNFLSIQGKIVSHGAFSENTQLTGFLKSDDSTTAFLVLPVDRNGVVKKDNLIFYDSARLYLNFNDSKREFDPSSFNVSNGLLQTDVKYGIANSIAQLPYEPDSLVAIHNMQNNKEVLKIATKQFKDAHELANVVVKGRQKTQLEKMDERYANGMFSGGNATSFDVVNDPLAAASLSVFQYLQGKVAGLMISGGGANPSISWRGGSPGLYLDEMQMDAAGISNINMSDVAYIKVFNPGSSAIFANGGNGVIAVYTRRGGDAMSNEPGRMGQVKMLGYSAVKEFYAPDYSQATGEEYYDNRRTTLYWMPMIVLDRDNRRLKIQFYNTDITKRFRIVLEGINQNGKLVHVEKIASK